MPEPEGAHQLDVAHVLDVSARDASAHPHAVRGLLDGSLDAVLVRGVLAPDEAAVVVSRLEGGRAEFPVSHFPPQFHAYFLGQCLDLAESLETYFGDATRYAAAAEQLFAGMEGFPRRALALFEALSGGPVTVPRDGHGRAYTHSTIRALEERGYIPPHCEHEQSRRPPYVHLRAQIRAHEILSYYLVLARSEAGGELCLSTLRFSDLGEGHMHNGRTQVADLVRDRPITRLAPDAGDVVVFYGGERIHWIAPCEGARTRWTMGGFVAPTVHGEGLLLWS